jgi:hypothetical protein
MLTWLVFTWNRGAITSRYVGILSLYNCTDWFKRWHKTVCRDSKSVNLEIVMSGKWGATGRITWIWTTRCTQMKESSFINTQQNTTCEKACLYGNKISKGRITDLLVCNATLRVGSEVTWQKIWLCCDEFWPNWIMKYFLILLHMQLGVPKSSITLK